MAKPTMTQAVMELYGTLSGFPTLYNEQIPEDAPQIPAAYFLHNGETPDYSTDNGPPSSIRGVFSIVLLMENADTLENDFAIPLMQAFLPFGLALTGGQTISLFRTNYTLTGTQWTSKAGNRVYAAKMDFKVIIGSSTF